MAAHEGHFEVLKWSIANGCPWKSNTFTLDLNLDQPVIPRWIAYSDCSPKYLGRYASALGCYVDNVADRHLPDAVAAFPEDNSIKELWLLYSFSDK